MADKPVPIQMIGEGDITVGAADGSAAGSANIQAMKAPTI